MLQRAERAAGSIVRYGAELNARDARMRDAIHHHTARPPSHCGGAPGLGALRPIQ